MTKFTSSLVIPSIECYIIKVIGEILMIKFVHYYHFVPRLILIVLTTKKKYLVLKLISYQYHFAVEPLHYTWLFEKEFSEENYVLQSFNQMD